MGKYCLNIYIQKFFTELPAGIKMRDESIFFLLIIQNVVSIFENYDLIFTIFFLVLIIDKYAREPNIFGGWNSCQTRKKCISIISVGA